MNPQPLPAPAPETPPTAPDSLARPFKLSRRFDRTGRLLGDSAMERLANARVVVFGLGGVGSFAAEGLVRSGIGHLTLVDHDDVCVTNTNRQLHATVKAVGKPKAELMAQRCQEINPAAKVEAVREFYRADVAEQMLQPGQYDFVVDAIDNVKAKLHLLHRCVTLGVPVVSSMGAAGRLDPTAIRVEDLSETHMDPFAKDIRKLLKRKYAVETDKHTGITAVYSIEARRLPVTLQYDDATDGFLCVCPQDNEFHTCDHRTQIDGSVAFVTSCFGMNAAGVVVRRLASAR
ncbi:ThiF domain protein [Myxococcus xanthus DK 1622]|uniref:ThiF domain protein n=7 Tax=Myxococcus TaxID=32 RepID=Q1DAV9_MYXXD|nr:MULTISPECIES: tRNA threonylcarbamoyladenosine dehydratase [Myxococcus]ABF91612.1 ThiF domain protein [Myxococcus xanthus DK 1622]NOJ57446.1 tRNA threonylcarbamoyladenosine dehydratase [Myxococcus xanthus]NOJ82963.1 tRNA threonylcarbamoyladenosine dehydratase [Myxococcus xanthus]QDE67194.1 tRNA threonylcarbamoyladenosine dehydratase [Myxococcus xanthus]QDE74469.1 tRNA threonylcarbamoyladenosine dehydratase [Myxococcus xanthus]